MADVDIDYDYIRDERETKHAILVVIEEDGLDNVEVWLPKSQIRVDERRKVITMPEWLGREKELI